jgi:hypothetical protein
MAVQSEGEAVNQDTVVVIYADGHVHTAVITTILTYDDGTAVETVERVRVEPDDRTYRLDVTVPDADVAKDGRWLLTVLLPVGAELVEPEIDDANDEIEETARFDGPERARRVAVWLGHKDPQIPLIWNLLH